MTHPLDAYHDDIAALRLEELPLEDRLALDARFDFLVAAEDAVEAAEDEAEFRDACFRLRAAEADAGLYL